MEILNQINANYHSSDSEKEAEPENEKIKMLKPESAPDVDISAL